MINTFDTTNIKDLLIAIISEIFANWMAIPKSNNWFFGKVNWSNVVNFVSQSLDKLIQFVEEKFPELNGQSKKEVVLQAASVIYDMISKEIMPVFLKPFNTQIKSFIINVVLSNIIDFLVKKYNEGGWNKEVSGGQVPQVQKS